MTRQVVLDTETTGLDVGQGDRVIEVGCVEIVDRRITGRVFQRYLNPGRDSHPEALAVHGLTSEFLADKPRFAEIAAELVDFLRDAEVLIHNAPFDVGFLDNEFALAKTGLGPMSRFCAAQDTVQLARRQYPGQRVTLDALCKRLGVDNSGRELHGALLDARLLAEVYLQMTGGQTHMFAGQTNSNSSGGAVGEPIRRLPAGRSPLPVLAASATEQAAHEALLQRLRTESGRPCEWPG